MSAMSEAVLAQARAGDERAFGALTDPYRRELEVHCYRMLGSLTDAEDALQETLLSAWRGLGQFEERASVRTWLYKIATNRCLNAIRDRSRRPRPTESTLPFTPPPATRMDEPAWLEPLPEAVVESLPDDVPGPDARYETREAVGLAFITALARLPARQRAVLVLRDVLGFRASEVAELLECSEATVNSALQRAREGLEDRAAPGARDRAPAPGSARERELAHAFAEAFEQGQIERIVSLLTEDGWVRMPPEPFEYQGRAAAAEFLAHTSLMAQAAGRTMRLVATRANGSPAFAQYLVQADDAAPRLSGLIVVTLAADGILDLTRFALRNLPPGFELPETLA